MLIQGGDDAEDTEIRMTDREQELWDRLHEAREALCGAMRVIAQIDDLTLLGIGSDTFHQRFVDEMHLIGLQDGFGVRIDDTLLKFKPLEARVAVPHGV